MTKIQGNSYKQETKPLKNRTKRPRSDYSQAGKWVFRLWLFSFLLWTAILFWVYRYSKKNFPPHVTEEKQVKGEKVTGKIRKDATPVVVIPPPSNTSVPNNVSTVKLGQSELHSGSSESTNIKANVPQKNTETRLHNRKRVSIIIDDMGGSIDMALKFLELPYPIAFAVLPYEPHSQEVSRLVKSYGKVLLLHMPMEPHEYPEKNPGKGALLLGQDRETQRKLFLRALERVPGAVGVNNHMGSKFTEDMEAMRFFMEMLKEKNLFFVDSATTSKTVACDVAREVGVRCFRRNVFLDHEPSTVFVNAQLVKLADEAREREITIAIGHPHKVTLDMLRRGLKDIQAKDIELVSIGLK